MELILEEVEQFITESPWVTSKDESHQYCLVKNCLSSLHFYAFVEYIREHGYTAKFYGKPYVYFEVGGFKYWTAVMRGKPPHTKVVASQFWMFKEVDSNKLIAEFYSLVEGKYKLIHTREVTITFPPHETDKMTTTRLEMALGDFDWLA